jgi:hypothetical protein
MTKPEVLQALRDGGELRQMRGSWWVFPSGGGYGQFVPTPVVEELREGGWIAGERGLELTEKGK